MHDVAMRNTRAAPRQGRIGKAQASFLGMEPKQAAVATAEGESSRAQAIGAPSGLGAAGPVIGLSAQLLLIAVLGRTVGLNGAAWVVGVTCGVGMSAGLALGLSHFGSERLASADWITLTRGTLAVGVAALVADSFGQSVPASSLTPASSIIRVTASSSRKSALLMRGCDPAS